MRSMLSRLYQILWLMLPAYMANMVPVFFRKVQFLNYPVDFGLKLNKKRVLGNNKTIRGFFFGILFSIVAVTVQYMLYPQSHFLQSISRIDYSVINPIFFGFLMGFSALFGDSVKSFFKRRINIPPGESWIPFDQIDYMIGVVLFTFTFIKYDWIDFIIILLITPLLNMSTSFIGFLLKIRKNRL